MKFIHNSHFYQTNKPKILTDFKHCVPKLTFISFGCVVNRLALSFLSISDLKVSRLQKLFVPK
jgi:hypothetical protein